MADPLSGRRGSERFGDRRGGRTYRLAVERSGRRPVKQREKLFATVVVMFPWIFPVEQITMVTCSCGTS